MTQGRKLWDVAIVGAGPAGSTAAIHLASRGHSVLLLDKDSFPRDKVCGDGLIADSIGALKRVGLYEEVCRQGYKTNLGVVYSPSRVQFDVPGEYLTLKRILLDDLIRSKAVASGAEFRQARVTGIESQPDGPASLSIAGADAPVRARIVLLATGASVELPDRLSFIAHQEPSAIALRCYVRSKVEFDRLLISYDRSILPGYAWIFPLGGGNYNIGCGAMYGRKNGLRLNLREAFQRFVKSFPIAAEIMRAAEEVTPLRGARLRCGLRGARAIRQGNILVIGESIGATFPFTGEGIGKAMETGEIAAEVAHQALSAGDCERLREYPARVERELRPKFWGYQVAEDWLAHPWLNDLVARRVRRSRYLQESVAGIVNETVDPRQVFSVRGVLRSFFG
ncbi:MAG TPA: NAD(P)/FAD-dependent oxidoreductase [Blastocatellia bacterium]|nr:NAD(P)/FAD-dependent oxidoreductase [Blastocatellia bacterium]